MEAKSARPIYGLYAVPMFRLGRLTLLVGRDFCARCRSYATGESIADACELDRMRRRAQVAAYVKIGSESSGWTHDSDSEPNL